MICSCNSGGFSRATDATPDVPRMSPGSPTTLPRAPDRAPPHLAPEPVRRCIPQAGLSRIGHFSLLEFGPFGIMLSLAWSHLKRDSLPLSFPCVDMDEQRLISRPTQVPVSDPFCFVSISHLPIFTTLLNPIKSHVIATCQKCQFSPQIEGPKRPTWAEESRRASRLAPRRQRRHVY